LLLKLLLLLLLLLLLQCELVDGVRVA